MLLLIRENFLHYLWKYKLFATLNLVSFSGKSIQILHCGMHNFDAGPDFFNAKIKIEGQLWAGNVEIHIKASDWYVHNHENDSVYDSVILHVVWDNDVSIFRKDNSIIETLVLSDYVNTAVLQNYKRLFQANNLWINCERQLTNLDSFLLDTWKEKLYIQRLERKTTEIIALLEQSNHNWEAVLFKLLAKNFGLKVNGTAFFNMANSFDFSVFRKYWHKNMSLEALLFGQAGLLFEDKESVYFEKLQYEYAYLKHKHNLKPISQTEVKFFRLRPNNFPTLRLSQLANLYFVNHSIFSKILEINDLDSFYNLFSIETSEFWKSHYSFETVSKTATKKLTKSFINLLLINTIIPLKFVYLRTKENFNVEPLLSLIREIPSERNRIITNFTQFGIPAKNALASQGLLELKAEYCNKNRCLDCAIGANLLRKSSTKL